MNIKLGKPPVKPRNSHPQVGHRGLLQLHPGVAERGEPGWPAAVVAAGWGGQLRAPACAPTPRQGLTLVRGAAGRHDPDHVTLRLPPTQVLYNNLYSSFYNGPSTFDQITKREAVRVVRDGLLKLRMDPFMMHQANLGTPEGSSLVMRWVDAAVNEYLGYANWPVRWARAWVGCSLRGHPPADHGASGPPRRRGCLAYSIARAVSLSRALTP
jgi:hypothetical protein